MDFNNAGGFLTSSQAGGAMDSPSGKKRGTSAQTVRPVTVKQLLNATQPHPDGEFQVDGSDIYQVTLLGRVLSLGDTSTSIIYHIDDGTGTMECRMWKDGRDSDYMAQKRALIQQGSYVRVYGQFKSFANKQSVQAFSVRLVTDYNEVTYHLLECILTHVRIKRGSAATTTHSNFGGNMMMDNKFMAQDYGAQNNDYNPHANNHQPQPSFSFGSDFTPIQQKILMNVKQSGDSNEGMNIPFLCRKMAPEGFSESQIRENIEWLIGEGHLYSTIDDDHCKATDDGF